MQNNEKRYNLLCNNMQVLKNGLNAKIQKRTFSYAWLALIICLIFITISYGIRFSFGVFFKPLEEEFGWTRALTSSVFSVYMLLGSVFAILGGWLADRHGPKMVFVAMGFFSFLGLALTSQANALWHLLISYSLFVAIGTGPTYAVASSIATKWFPMRRGLALAIVTSGVGLGSILVAPVAAYLIVDYGWRISYIAIGLIALIIMVPLGLFLKKTLSEVPDSSNSYQQTSLNTPCASNRSDGRPEKLSVVRIIKERNFVLLSSIWFFYSFCLFMVMAHIVPHAIDLGIDSIQAASIISISGFSNIPARIVMGMVSDRFGRKRAALICASLMSVTMLWLIQSSSLWMFYVFAIAFGAAYGGLGPSASAVVGDTFGIRHIGFVFGLLEVGWVCGAAVGPALAGYIFDVTGNYYLAFLFGILATLINVILVLFLRVPVDKNKK